MFTNLCTCVSFSQTFPKGLVTQFTTPLDPNTYAKLDRSSDTRWSIWNKVASLDSTAIYHKPSHQLLYTPMTGEMKCPIGYTFALRIPFHLLQCWYNTCTNLDQQMIWSTYIITWPCWFIDLDLTCFSPLPSSIGVKSCSSFTATRSIAPKPPTCPSRLQPIHQTKSCLDLLHLSHMTQCHVSCNELLHHMCEPSNKSKPSSPSWHELLNRCTCRLITCVSHI